MAKLPSKNYLAERLRKAAEGPENRSAESLQRGAIERGNREQAREAQGSKAKRPMAKGGKAMKKPVKKYAKGGKIDGCATKGKTKTKMVKMAMGGLAGRTAMPGGGMGVARGMGMNPQMTGGGPATGMVRPGDSTFKRGGSCGMKKGK